MAKTTDEDAAAKAKADKAAARAAKAAEKKAAKAEAEKAVSDTATAPPKKKTRAVKSTAETPQAPSGVAVKSTAERLELPTPGVIHVVREGEPTFVLAIPQRDCNTLLEVVEWFRSGPESLPQRKELPSGTRRFPETLPSYSGKTKDSLSLVSDRWKLALKRAQALWPNQKIEKGNFACWLVERFLAETEDQGNEGDEPKGP